MARIKANRTGSRLVTVTLRRMSAPKLQRGEQTILAAHPTGWNLAYAYLFTLGLYEVWRRATWFTVTDQRVILSKGIITRTQRSIPVDMVQDATVTTQLGIGTVFVTTAGGQASALRLSPLTSAEAHEISDAILTQRRAARA